MICVFANRRNGRVEIRDRMDDKKETLITVSTPDTTLFDMTLEQFGEMVRDYAVKRVDQDLVSRH